MWQLSWMFEMETIQLYTLEVHVRWEAGMKWVPDTEVKQKDKDWYRCQTAICHEEQCFLVDWTKKWNAESYHIVFIIIYTYICYSYWMSVASIQKVNFSFILLEVVSAHYVPESIHNVMYCGSTLILYGVEKYSFWAHWQFIHNFLVQIGFSLLRLGL